MIKLLGKIPVTVNVAVSGGPDSMAVLDFLRKGKRNVTAVYFNHNTAHGYAAQGFVTNYCVENEIPLITGHIKNPDPMGKSKEEYWRNERHAFFTSLDGPVVTGHHLDDSVEWWVFSSLHGTGRLIPYSRDNVIRPFLLTPRSSLLAWNDKNNLPYLNDPGNKDESFMRSIVRHKIVPEALRVNPGLRKVLFKKIQSESVNLESNW